jgi:hypothetical protein
MAQASVNKGSRAFLIATVAVFALALAAVGWYFWGVEAIIVTVPPDAQVLIDGQPLSAQSYGRFVAPHLTRRLHTLKVQRDAYSNSKQELDFRATEFTDWITVRLTPDTFHPTNTLPLVQGTEQGSPPTVLTSSQGQHSLQLTSAQQDAVTFFLQAHPELQLANCQALGLADTACANAYAEWEGLVRTANATLQFPFAAWGDFNRDGLLDIALPLFSRSPVNNNNWRNWSFVVFQGSSDGHFNPVIAAKDQWGLCFDGMLYHPVRQQIEYWCGSGGGSFRWTGTSYKAKRLMGD